MVRGSDGVISLTFGYLEISDQGQLLKKTVSVRESAIVTTETCIGTDGSRIG